MQSKSNLYVRPEHPEKEKPVEISLNGLQSAGTHLLSRPLSRAVRAATTPR